MSLPILYSFRRCPYAIRARLAIYVSGYQCQLREVFLRNKPEAMISASPKATVPVLIETNNSVIEQSLDIMLHVLRIHDPEGWLGNKQDQQQEMLQLIDRTEEDFKPHLDLYKYANKAENPNPQYHRSKASKFIDELELRLSSGNYLSGEKLCLADWAILPFIRQFAQTDRNWFDAQHWPHLHPWLQEFEASKLRSNVMKKYSPWAPGDTEMYFPTLLNRTK